MTERQPRRPSPEALARWTPRVGASDPRDPSVSDEAATAWDGVVWGRLGRGDRAWTCWDAVRDPSLSAWLAAERGRVLRELGLHTAAAARERDGLADARDVTDAVMLRISLAASTLGEEGDLTSRLTRATTMLEMARAMLLELSEGPRTARQRLRAAWVGAELALAAGERPDADLLPGRGSDGPVHPPEADAGTDFHRAKGLLFAGVVREDPWFLRAAAPLAPPALLWAVELARLDAGDEEAAARALGAWDQLRPPQEVAPDVAGTATARRLEALR